MIELGVLLLRLGWQLCYLLLFSCFCQFLRMWTGLAEKEEGKSADI